MTAFVLLPDGRCDILPTDPRYTLDDITGATAAAARTSSPRPWPSPCSPTPTPNTP
ncbi:hypothetical protein [Streptomyces virginiae]|uniref:hypothetical protein n=1 Tax=Streptomyces virginiae TaxID=1961 RepID=UPI0034163B04